MTDALENMSAETISPSFVTCPARDVRTAVENPNNPHIADTAITSQTALTGVCVYGLIAFHHFDPGRALSLVMICQALLRIKHLLLYT